MTPKVTEPAIVALDAKYRAKLDAVIAAFTLPEVARRSHLSKGVIIRAKAGCGIQPANRMILMTFLEEFPR